MEAFNVKVTNWIENKEAQELFFNLGASWCYGKQINENIPSDRDIVLHNFGSQLFWAHTYETENFKDSEEITLQELRDMVKPKVKEYLFKYNDQYTLVELSKEDAESNPEQYIEVPEGADVYARCNIFGDYKWLPKIIDGDWSVLWQREKESLNDKIATAEVVRQESKNIDTTLAERQSQYGSFTGVANTTGQLMAVIKNSPNGHTMPYTHEEALHMICSKIARIVNGDINHLDSWHDIGGYSKLIEDLIGDNNEI